jgi:hypothetical protein
MKKVKLLFRIQTIGSPTVKWKQEAVRVVAILQSFLLCFAAELQFKVISLPTELYISNVVKFMFQ